MKPTFILVDFWNVGPSIETADNMNGIVATGRMVVSLEVLDSSNPIASPAASSSTNPSGGPSAGPDQGSAASSTASSTAKPTASSNANSSDGIKVAGFVGGSKTMITVMSAVIWAHLT
jgi:hypothetical protein